jgi:ABC-type branched-subunit amino acid transport system ATPase component
MLTIKELFFGWDNDNLFENLSADFTESELIQLKGENGVGKTTLLQLISGMIPHFNRGKTLKGDILLNGSSVIVNPPKTFFPEIAFIPSNNIDLFLITDCLMHDILLTQSLLKINQKTVENKISDFYQFFPSTQEIINDLYERLSPNYKIVALTFIYYLQGAKLFLFDEVLNGFTKNEIESWYSFFNFLISQNCSVIFVGHHLTSDGLTTWLLKNKKVMLL